MNVLRIAECFIPTTFLYIKNYRTNFPNPLDEEDEEIILTEIYNHNFLYIKDNRNNFPNSLDEEDEEVILT